MQCAACGTEVPAESTFCPKCGQRLQGNGGPGAQARGAEVAAAERFRNEAESRVNVEPPSEEVLWEGNYSGKAMVGSWLLVLLATVALIAAGVWFNNSNAWLAVAGICVAAWAIVALVMGYRKASVHYVLRQERLIHEKGILKRVTDRIETIDIDDVTCEQGFVERVLGVGSIRIHSSDRTHPELLLLGIAEVNHVAELIDDVRRRERRRRGLHIESI